MSKLLQWNMFMSVKGVCPSGNWFDLSVAFSISASLGRIGCAVGVHYTTEQKAKQFHHFYYPDFHQYLVNKEGSAKKNPGSTCKYPKQLLMFNQASQHPEDIFQYTRNTSTIQNIEAQTGSTAVFDPCANYVGSRINFPWF